MRTYYVIAGQAGCLPDYIAPYESPHDGFPSQREAQQELRWLTDQTRDQCDITHPGRCYLGRLKDGAVTFRAGHGVDYAEIITSDGSPL